MIYNIIYSDQHALTGGLSPWIGSREIYQCFSSSTLFEAELN